MGAGGPVCRPCGGDVASPGGASGRPRPTKGAAGASPRPTVFQKQSLSWVEEPWCSLRRHAPGSQRAGEGTRPYGVFTNGSTYRKRDRFLTCPLKHRGETQFRIKFLCLLSFSKKVGYTGPWRKRSIISWVREMADPPWGRFSRSNQVPSPSSSSWRVTVSSSVSRSQ